MEIVAPVPGLVASVPIVAGAAVAEGDVVVILQSMKTEIPVVTEIPGVVRELYVDRASVVREGDVIALIDES